MRGEEGTFPSYFYIVLFSLMALFQVTKDTLHINKLLVDQSANYAMIVSWMSFANKISDPLVGGTFLSLLSAFSNIGWLWPRSVSLWLVDQTTFK